MEVMFAGFDDGGWWLVILGCRGQPELAENWLENTKQQLGEGLACRERKEREDGFWVRLCFFWPI